MAVSSDLASAQRVAQWLARRETAHDTVTAGLIDRFRGTFRRPVVPPSGPGSTAPLGIHRALTPDAVAHDAIGPDGLAVGASLYPQLPQLGSVMWGGGTMEFATPFTVGDEVTRVSRLVALDEKTGKAGRLVFAQIENVFSAGGVVRVHETETIAFRQPSPLEATAKTTAPDLRKESWDFRREVPISTVMLFEYSAITFNTHRIHYDQPYATGVEKYPALLAHGPLSAILLIDTCAAEIGSERIERVTVRAQRPVFCGTTVTLAGRKVQDGSGGLEMAALDEQGRPLMFGTVTLRD